ncbi:DUF2163 domain-containing protein [Parvularcula lutaonensis]|uniref:DUF2163 domain-containing protein n=1 Tax=Parvularcula lutaonensis TaxID=491923 RepID=A0ABV7MEP1_9PROT|nr:DUF2163 domain-containing protein [Parvularcula lutaonensis]GGY53235.1 hypothetical protein GCM10007148_23090 [Parvularcula lutaonensis]
MKSIDAHTKDRLSRQGAATAHAVRLFRTDGAITALTDWNRDLTFGGIVHHSEPGLTVESLQHTADLAPDFGAFTTSLSEQGITENGLARGLYARIRAEIWRVDGEDPDARLLLSVGTIGEIERTGDRLSLEFRGLSQALAKPTGRVYQKSCDAQLGDARCGVDLTQAAHTASGTIVQFSGLSLDVSVLPLWDPADFAFGTLIVESGELSGARRAIRASRAVTGGLSLTLWEQLPGPLAPGDTVRLSVGCDKEFATCKARFQNHERFRGFPTIPGMDVLVVQPGGGA